MTRGSVVKKNHPVSLIPVQQRMSSHVDWGSYRCLHCTGDTEYSVDSGSGPENVRPLESSWNSYP
jgi:hypothetical protein